MAAITCLTAAGYTAFVAAGVYGIASLVFHDIYYASKDLTELVVKYIAESKVECYWSTDFIKFLALFRGYPLEGAKQFTNSLTKNTIFLRFLNPWIVERLWDRRTPLPRT